MSVGSTAGSGPLTVPELIAELVVAVRVGDEERIRYLMWFFAAVADVPALFALRDALMDDAPAG